MADGSGLTKFAKKYPKRFFDVGIAEQHALTFAAGLASNNIKPVVAIYSSFLQRGYDQFIHDVALQNIPMLFAIDRAGIVGADGPTHSGNFDISFLRCIPNIVLMAPSNENESYAMLKFGYKYKGVCAVRYPRGNGLGNKLNKINAKSNDAIISSLNAHYLTDGINSLKSIDDNTIDFIWSQAVLEHIRYSEFDNFFAELNRILKIGGVSSHRIDLKDHLSGGLKNLFFSDFIWESKFMSSSGFYTNRIRYKEMIKKIQDAGFDVELVNIDKWDKLPDRKSLMQRKFSKLSDSELCISGFDVLLTKK